MYIPSAFAVNDLSELHGFMEQNSFGLLVSDVEGAPFASHLPFLLERSAGSQGMLLGHMARSNPQWQYFASQPVLVVFSGPHAYISPTWYVAENTVPTWNYMAVHAYGRIKIVEDESALAEIVQRAVTLYEQKMPQPWTFDLQTKFAVGLLSQIVGFNVEIERLEGKFKLNQNQTFDRQEKVAAALLTQRGEDAQAIAAAMHERLRSSKK